MVAGGQLKGLDETYTPTGNKDANGEDLVTVYIPPAEYTVTPDDAKAWVDNKVVEAQNIRAGATIPGSLAASLNAKADLNRTQRLANEKNPI